jgi:hypothetical protein
MMDDRPYEPRPIDGTLLLAPSADSWQSLRAVLLDNASPDS